MSGLPVAPEGMKAVDIGVGGFAGEGKVQDGLYSGGQGDVVRVEMLGMRVYIHSRLQKYRKGSPRLAVLVFQANVAIVTYGLRSISSHVNAHTEDR